MTVWVVDRCRPTERDLSREDVALRVRANLENLTSQDPGRGIAALKRFKSDMDAYLQGPAFLTECTPFSIPGLWVFSHERHIHRKWLQAVRPLCRERGVIDRLDEVCGSLFKRWLRADYLIEKCLMSGDGRSLKGLTNHLAEIVKEEQRAVDGWEALNASI
jgi:hypothetical protein